MTPEVREREKLLRARGEIEQVLARHDLIAHVVLAGQHGLSEVFLPLGATWSNLRLEDNMVRLRSKAEDYRGNKAKQKRDLESTLGALSSMSELTMHAAGALLEASEQFDAFVGAEHTTIRKEHKQ